MAQQTHYLNLAYLAESALIFNLAYIELEWKNKYKKLKSKVDSGSSLVTTITDRKKTADSTCSAKNCDICQGQTNAFHMYDIRYISEMAAAVHKVGKIGFKDFTPKGLKRFSLLFRAWSHSKCSFFTKYFIALFHIIAQTSLDKYISKCSIVLATSAIIFMTMGDSRFDIFDFWPIAVSSG